MTRTHVNFVIDALAFAAFLLLASTGVLLRYQLPPGSGGLLGRGGGRGEAQQTVLTIWNWTRHDWGAVHFWIACALLAVLAVHLFLHWNWIVCVVRGKGTDRSGWRLGLGAVSLGALVLLAAAPWLSPTESRTRHQLQYDRATTMSEPDRPDSPDNLRNRDQPVRPITDEGAPPDEAAPY